MIHLNGEKRVEDDGDVVGQSISATGHLGTFGYSVTAKPVVSEVVPFAVSIERWNTVN